MRRPFSALLSAAFPVRPSPRHEVLSAVLLSWGRLGVRGAREVRDVLRRGLSALDASRRGWTGDWWDRNAGRLASALLVLLLAWSAFAKVDQVVRFDGRITAHGRTQEITHLEGGIVEEVLVSEGQSVKSGDVLVRLRKTSAFSRMGETTAKKDALRAEAARLEAEIEGWEPVFPEGLPDEAVARQRSVFFEGAAEVRHSKDQFAARIRQHEGELGEASARRSALSSKIGPAQEMAAMQESLGSQGRRSDVLAAKMAVADIKSQLAPLEGTLERARAGIEELRAGMEEADSKRRSAAAKRLAEVRSDLAGIEHGLAQDQDRAERTELRSPMDGRVKVLFANTLGGTLPPGGKAAEITPTGSGLLIEGRLRPEDRANVFPGLKVEARVGSYDSSFYGTLQAEVVEISSDAIESQDGRTPSYYRILAKAESDTLPFRVEGDRAAPEILPGMPVVGDVLVGRRTLAGRLFSPVLRSARLAAKGR